LRSRRPLFFDASAVAELVRVPPCNEQSPVENRQTD
jgi:hypothetical protein